MAMMKNVQVPTAFRWRGSVIPKVLLTSISITLLSVAVVLCYKKTEFKPSIPFSFITVLGFIVGLLLTYRTNTAYDRYWEGRRIWSTMVVSIRALARNIWVNMQLDSKKDIIEKKSAINLVLGFAIATKYYLRGKDGNSEDCKDLKHLISNITSQLPGWDQLEASTSREKKREEKSEKKPWFGARLFNKVFNRHHHHEEEKEIKNHNIPLELLFYLTSFFNDQPEDILDNPSRSICYTSMNSLTDCLTQFERILRTPIPKAYSIHLAQTVFIYCVTLPFQLVSFVDYWTIPIVFISCIVLLGVEGIGEEIENPFGLDDNDLDLDQFCIVLEKEINTITAHAIPNLEPTEEE
ncbi:9453_t:CDS:2, partial [Diversispora eburnea]